WTNDVGLKRAGRLEVLQANPFEVLTRREPLDPVGITLIDPLVVPKPVFAPVGKDHERGRQVLGVSPRLLLRVVGVKVLALGFEDAEHPPEAVLQEVVRAAARSIRLEPALLRGQSGPAARCPAL